jgi:hypothetical protein
MGARLVACAAAAAMALLASPAWTESECRAWPGEPSPLPTSTDADGALARWAQLRSLELRALAERSARDPVTIDRLVRHADCLAPVREPAPEALTPRSHLAVRIHRPGLAIVGRGSKVEEAKSVAAALAHLGEPLPIARRVPDVQPPPTNAANIEVSPRAEEGVATAPDPAPPAEGVGAGAPADVARTPPVPAPTPAVQPTAVTAEPSDRAAVATGGAPEAGAPEATPQTHAAIERPPAASEAVEAPEAMSVGRPELPAVSAAPPLRVLEESWLADAEASLAGARFEETLEMAAEARAALASEADPSSLRTQAELEVLGGAAALALGRDEEAAEHFARARSLDPDLTLNPSRHSPKVIRAFAVPEEAP